MSNITTEQLIKAGQIKQGDKLLCWFNGELKLYTAKEILNAETDREEIILKRRRNIYFITSMAIDGSSWAKNVHIVRSA